MLQLADTSRIDPNIKYTFDPIINFLEVFIEQRGYLQGQIVTSEDDQTVSGEILDFSTVAKRMGYGERLMRAFVAEVKARGATILLSDSIEVAALQLRAKVFGKLCLDFYDAEYDRGMPLPLTFEQAVASIELQKTFEQGEGSGLLHYLGYVGVRVDLTQVETSAWKRPVPFEQLAEAI